MFQSFNDEVKHGHLKGEGTGGPQLEAILHSLVAIFIKLFSSSLTVEQNKLECLSLARFL
jgi:hypothetical protein